MKIGIDARLYGPKQGGIGRYIEQLILNLEKIDRTNEYVIFLRKKNWDSYSPANSNFKKVLADIPWYGWSEQILLPTIIRKQKVDLMHFPHWNIPLFYNEPFIVTVHDLLLLNYPTRESSMLGPVSYFFKNLAYKIIIRHAVRAAKKIITPSEFTKTDVSKTFGMSENKIIVTHLAPAPLSYLSGDDNLLNKYYITGPYALYVGVAYPHKNLNRLLQAWKLIEEKYGHAYQLVLAGKENFFYHKLTNSPDFQNLHSVIFTGYLNDADLSLLFKNSSLYVFPSLYEGFGLPPLEAMQYGIPVASSNSTCLPEILGPAALYFNPKDMEEMAGTIGAGLTDDNIRERLKINAKNILLKYSWQTTAGATLQAYISTGDKGQNGV